ncbi:MAG: hypothetical protein SOW31_09540 [Treponema sp.]|nr:hypothetical protein [Treponema sp.]
MKKSFVIIYSIIISLILVFAISLFGYNIYTDYKKGNIAADNRFERMSLSIKQIPESVKLNSRDFENSILRAINGIENYSSLSIEINDQPYINYPTEKDMQQGSSKLIVNKYKTFDLHGNKITITANLYVLTPAVINHDVKISFAIILFVTVLTLFLIMLDALLGKNSKMKSKPEDSIYVEPETDEAENEKIIKAINEAKKSDDELDEIEKKEAVIEEKEMSVSEVAMDEKNEEIEAESALPDSLSDSLSDPLFENIELNDNEEEQTSTDESFLTTDESILTTDENQIIIPKFEENGHDFKITTIEEPVEEEKISEEIEASEINEYKTQLENDEVLPLPSDEIKPMNIEVENDSPAGLFSPVTGFGWESYLNTRLDNELNRATASESDLSLFIIKIKEVSRESDITKKICGYLTTQFQFKDMIFEFREDSYVALKIGTSIDDAISFANKLLLDIDNILNGFGKCYIGISTRSVRMVNAERLVNEAEQALKHAEQEADSPIIAFRVDADKYRKFLEEKE